MIHVSLDIEACGEVLVSIGACTFDVESGKADQEFYSVLAIQPQLERGLKMDGEAFLWWLKQGEVARAAVTKEHPEEPWAAIHRFRDWLISCGAGATLNQAKVWAYPTSFDLPIIERVAKTFTHKAPWWWQGTMDGRTLWQLALIVDPKLDRIERDNTARHHALEDAKQQARWYAAYWKAVVRR